MSKIFSTAAVAITVALAPAGACAQSKKLGAYVGTIEVSHSLPTLTYAGTIKVTMPVSERDSSSVTAEFLAGEAPDAMVRITRWDTFRRETSADSGGQFNTTACSLAQPVEVPMSATGVLNVDLRKKTHAFSLALVSKRQLDFNCTHSRSGAHKKKMGITLMAGTGAPGMHYETRLPFSDAARLAAKHTLTPPGANKADQGPIVQAWDLKLAP